MLTISSAEREEEAEEEEEEGVLVPWKEGRKGSVYQSKLKGKYTRMDTQTTNTHKEREKKGVRDELITPARFSGLPAYAYPKARLPGS